MNFIKQDVRQAIRQLRKSGGFSAAVIATLALGIGANLTVFLILYGALLKPLPFLHPEQLVRLERVYPNGASGVAFSGTKALFIGRANRTLESTAAYDYIPSNANLEQGDDVVPVKMLRTSSDFFNVFGMPPAMGRGFSAQDGVPNAPGVAVISDALWRQRFGADRSILGRGVTLGNQSYTVIGVARPEFKLDAKVDVWTPLQIKEFAGDRSQQYNLAARLKPGVTQAQAEDDLKRVQLEFKSSYPEMWDAYESDRTLDFHDSLVGNVRPALEILMGAVALLLLIVSANILSLLLTRAIARRREMSVRAALGASSWRILRQLLAENVVLCIAGGVAGLALARFAAPALMRLSPIELPAFSSLEIGGPALLFTAALTLICALIFSLVPAFETRRAQLNESLRVNTTQIAAGRHLAQKALVVCEVAVSLVLLAAAGVLLAGFWKLGHSSPGFKTKNVMTFKNTFTSEQAATSAGLSLRVNELVDQLGALPGVESAAAVISLPTQLVPDLPFDIAGRAKDGKDAEGDEKYIPISGRYFDALGIPVIAGRAFTAADTHGSAPVLIVNQEFARTYFKNENPIGQHVHIGAMMGPGFEDPVREIVGVVGDVKQTGLDMDAPGIMYLPASQIPDKLTQMGNNLMGISWIVSTKSAGVDVATPARRIFTDGPHTPLLSVEALDVVVSASIAQQRFTMILLSGFGLISLVLGATGLYGVMSYTIARRTKEIGVRMAIGAQRGDILGMVLREAGVLLGVGMVAGLVLAVMIGRLVQRLLPGVTSQAGVTLAAVCALLLAAGLFAAWWPARRAASTEPMQALRTE